MSQPAADFEARRFQSANSTHPGEGRDPGQVTQAEEQASAVAPQ